MIKRVSPFSLERKAAEVKNPSFQMAFKTIEVKEDGSIKIKGFASTPDIDRYDDVVKPDAFKSAMEGYMKNPVVLLGHSGDKVLGHVTEYNLSDKGLEVTAVLTNDIDNCFKNIQDKNLRGFSIGFICKAWGYRDEGNKQIREITDLDLIEISVVSTPANPSSLFSMAKSFRMVLDQEEKKSADEEEGTTVSEATATMTNLDDRPGENAEGKTEETTTETTTETTDTSTEEKSTEEGAETTTTTTETAEGGDTTTNPNTTVEEAKGEEEAPTVTDGKTTEEGKSEVVKADEKPEDKPTGLTEEEAKALIATEVENLVAKAVEEALKTVTDTMEKAIKSVTDENTALKSEVKALTDKATLLEKDILGISVSKGISVSSTPTDTAIVTDRFVLKSMGR